MATIRGVWTQLSSSEQLQRSSQSVAALNGKVYVFGGELVARKPRDNHVLELGTDGTHSQPKVRSVTSSEPTPRVGATMTAVGDKLYVFSGRGGEAMTPLDERGAFQVYDVSASSWSTVTPADATAAVPEPRSYHCATTDGSRIYIHAGCPENGRLHDLWAFSIESRIWTKLADAPGLPRGGTSITFSDNKLWRMNGFDGQSEIGGALDVYDLSANKWATIEYAADGKVGPGARSVGALLAVSINNEPHLLTLFGEADPSSLGHAGAGKMLSDAWAYSIATEKWMKIASEGGELPKSRGWFDAATVASGKVAVTGGLADTNERIADAWLLELS